MRGADLRDAAVARHDDNGREVTLEGAVQVREALNVEHVHLTNEKESM